MPVQHRHRNNKNNDEFSDVKISAMLFWKISSFRCCFSRLVSTTINDNYNRRSAMFCAGKITILVVSTLCLVFFQAIGPRSVEAHESSQIIDRKKYKSEQGQNSEMAGDNIIGRSLYTFRTELILRSYKL